MSRYKAVACFGAAALVLASFVGTAYAFFRDETPAVEEKDRNVGNAVDDIEENWNLRDTNLGDQYYDLYFFIQQEASQVYGDPLTSYIPRTQDTYGYWRDETAAGVDLEYGIERQSGVSPLYGYRKITVFRSMSTDMLNAVGTGLTDALDSNNYYKGFSGWTYNKQTASSMITTQQGEYNYFSTQLNLAELDASDEDGSEAGDHVIYLYPIYTTGKNYNANPKAPAVRLQDPEMVESNIGGGSGAIVAGEAYRYLSHSGSNVDSTYYYNDLYVDQDRIDRGASYILTMTPMHSTTEWDAGWIGQNETAALFPVAGTYNLTIKLYLKTNSWESGAGSMTNAAFFDRYNEEAMSGWINTLDQVSVTSVRIQNNGTYTRPDGSVASGHWPFVMFISVSMVFEPRLLGGTESTFDYNQERPLFFEYDGWFGDTSYNAGITDGEMLRTYTINNVFLDTTQTFDYLHEEHVAQGDEDYPDGEHTHTETGQVKRSVFTLDVSELNHEANNFWHQEKNLFPPMTPDDLSQLSNSNDEWFADGEWYTIENENPDAILRRAVPQPLEDGELSSEYDYQIRRTWREDATQGQLEYFQNPTDPHRDMVAVTRSGYYDIAVAIVYDKDIEDEIADAINPDEIKLVPVNYIDSLKIAVRPVQNNNFVRIYQTDDFEYHLPSGAEANGTPFITWDFVGTNSYGNRLVYLMLETNPMAEEESSINLSYDEEVFVAADDTTGQRLSLQDIIDDNGGQLFDHVSGRNLALSATRTLTLDRNFILYLTP